MRVAEVLSDLTSLRACEHSAALALVSARPQSSTTIQPNEAVAEDTDTDLQRAKDLVQLHYSVKTTHAEGVPDQGLLEARNMVEEALASQNL